MESGSRSQPGVSKRKRKQHPISENGLQILHEALGLTEHPSPTWSDSILISIDFENTDNIGRGFAESEDCQAGLATLETRDLQRKYSPEDLIKTYNFITGPPSYVKKASERFLFGKSKQISPADLLKEIQTIVTQNRRTIITGYGVGAELKVLRALGFTLSASTAVIDTSRIADEVFGSSGGTLRSLLRRIRCPYTHLHSAGNDANFTLRACLLLAIHKRENIDQAISNYLWQVSSSPIPYLVDCAVKAAQRKANLMTKQLKAEAKRARQDNRRKAAAAAASDIDIELPDIWTIPQEEIEPPELSDDESYLTLFAELWAVEPE
ncbi:hypothetical protein F5Y14DRAFT_459101 [Nemania sp. NC0429]|nr:hypothetical protein F5Y14DRAFT_459101 [Nemania sp. NC0429]